jgi:hypothetical protein
MLLRARIFFRYLTFAVGRQLRQRVAGEAGFEAAVLLRYLRKMDGFLDRSKGWDFLAHHAAKVPHLGPGSGRKPTSSRSAARRFDWAFASSASIPSRLRKVRRAK